MHAPPTPPCAASIPDRPLPRPRMINPDAPGHRSNNSCTWSFRAALQHRRLPRTQPPRIVLTIKRPRIPLHNMPRQQPRIPIKKHLHPQPQRPVHPPIQLRLNHRRILHVHRQRLSLPRRIRRRNMRQRVRYHNRLGPPPPQNRRIPIPRPKRRLTMVVMNHVNQHQSSSIEWGRRPRRPRLLIFTTPMSRTTPVQTPTLATSRLLSATRTLNATPQKRKPHQSPPNPPRKGPAPAQPQTRNAPKICENIWTILPFPRPITPMGTNHSQFPTQNIISPS